MLRPGPHEAEFGGVSLHLTPLEFAMLVALMRQKDRVLSRDELVGAAYKLSVHVSARTIDSHIRNIRHKLGEAGAGPVIETVHGVGFRLGACLPASAGK